MEYSLMWVDIFPNQISSMSNLKLHQCQIWLFLFEEGGYFRQQDLCFHTACWNVDFPKGTSGRVKAKLWDEWLHCRNKLREKTWIVKGGRIATGRETYWYTKTRKKKDKHVHQVCHSFSYISPVSGALSMEVYSGSEVINCSTYGNRIPD